MLSRPVSAGGDPAINYNVTFSDVEGGSLRILDSNGSIIDEQNTSGSGAFIENSGDEVTIQLQFFGSGTGTLTVIKNNEAPVTQTKTATHGSNVINYGPDTLAENDIYTVTATITT